MLNLTFSSADDEFASFCCPKVECKGKSAIVYAIFTKNNCVDLVL